jgi:hypothetical protein
MRNRENKLVTDRQTDKYKTTVSNYNAEFILHCKKERERERGGGRKGESEGRRKEANQQKPLK